MMERNYKALDIAAWFLSNIDRESGESITHLKLQKLVYYAQAWALALLGRPLFEDEVQAWAHGPVVESVFHKYKGHGWDAIPCPETDVLIDEETEHHLREIMDVYGDFSAKHLEQMTHAEGPWRLARSGLPPHARSSEVITKDSMKTYYLSLYKRLNDDKAGKGKRHQRRCG